MRRWNRRQWMAALMIFSLLLLILVTAAGLSFEEAAGVTDFSRRNLAPCPEYPFGTDFMGRDMFRRTVTGLSVSIRLGILTAAVSAVIAFFLGLPAGLGIDALMRRWSRRRIDRYAHKWIGGRDHR